MWQTERSRRLKILSILAVAVIGGLILRLAWMQVLQGSQYKQIAEENRIRPVIEQAPRGSVHDRRGAVMADNRPSFALSVIPREYANPAATALLASWTGIAASELDAMIQAGREFPYSPVRIKRDINQALMARIEEHRNDLPGVMVEAIPVRQYAYGKAAAHLLGYVGLISQDEYESRKGQDYHMSDLVGKDGIEREWEHVLRGNDGARQIEVNAMGEEVGMAGSKQAVPGHSLTLTVDMGVQLAAESALAEQIAASRQMGQPAKGGAAVVIDVRSGGVIAMASHPAYDPNAFASGISAKNWQSLMNDGNHPLANRVIHNAYPPGSVFKVVTAAAALENRLTDEEEVFDDRGVYVLNGWSFYGWKKEGLGTLRMADALAWSSDPVFYELGRRLGADNLAAYALTFGYGRLSGLALPGEEGGFVPTEEWKSKTYREPWYPGETLIAAIGQGYYNATPLQQALLMMAVANGGVIYRPRLVDKVAAPDGSLTAQYGADIERTVYLRPDVWHTIRQGLIGVTTRGTAAAVFANMNVTVAGKTGSSETGRGTTHSWFACYAPADNPEIAVAVLVEEGGDGSVAAAPVARRILEAYFASPGPSPAPAPPGRSE